MMNTVVKTSGFSKIRKLITVLKKCNGKMTADSSKALISPKAIKVMLGVGLGILGIGIGVLCYVFEPVIAMVIPVSDIMRSLMLLMLILSFILSVKNIVTVLYTADDLPVLLPMPFTSGQIVSAKLAVASNFPLILSLILLNTVGFGLGIRAGESVLYYIGVVLSSVLVPLAGIALALLLVVIIFRVFGFIRNRDITMVLGSLFSLLILIAYVVVNNSLRDDSEIATAALGALSSVAGFFPNISFMSDFMFSGNFLGLLISLAVTAAVVGVAFLAVKAFYLNTALSMQSTSTSKKNVSSASLSRSKKSDALRALTRYERRSAQRNPAYLVNGFLIPMIWPLFVVLPLVIGKDSLFTKLILPMGTLGTTLAALLIALTASCFACGFNVLPVSAFSREGATYEILRAIPLGFSDYYKSKRDFSLAVCSISSVGYILILGVVAAVTGAVTTVDLWVIPFAMLVSLLVNVTLINFMLWKNSAKPVFNWDSEAEIGRKLTWVNMIALVVAFAAYIGLIIVLIVFSITFEKNGGVNTDTDIVITVIVAVAALAVFGALCFVVNRIAVKKAESNLKKLA